MTFSALSVSAAMSWRTGIVPFSRSAPAGADREKGTMPVRQDIAALTDKAEKVMPRGRNFQ